ncbi:MAG: hypothetical protein HYR67_14485 [Bacteroidetes bacterium]|nr:hypothetical protein [Bacteroidota bacterium]
MKNTALILLAAFAIGTASAQTITEVTHPLSKASQKGFIDQIKVGEDGTIKLLYQTKGGGKNEIVSEEYDFAPDFKLAESKTLTTQKDVKEDKEMEVVRAWVGACSSFDINSMKVRISQDKLLMKWDYKGQRYVRKKTLDSETIKVKNEKGKFYYGIDDFYDVENRKIVLFVYMETKDKATPRQYAIVKVNSSGEVEEIPIDLTGSYSIVYTQKLAVNDNDDSEYADDAGFVAVLASNDKANFNKYVLLNYDLAGKERSKMFFESPSPNLLVTGATQSNGAVYLFGYSVKSKEGYKDEFDDYQPMVNPCYKEYNNVSMYSYTKKADRSMDFFHFIKIQNNKMQFASTAPMASIKSNVKTPPSQKGGSPFKGGKFLSNTLAVSPSGDILMTGQLVGWGFVRGISSTVTTYGDIVCLHFDQQGQFKAQYAIDRLDDDKKSKVFRVKQNFYFSQDGGTAIWEIWEAKGSKGFANFYDAYNNVPSFRARFYPRIGKINLASPAISDFSVIGKEKYFIDDSIYDAKSNTILYIGKDEDEANIWLANVKLN